MFCRFSKLELRDNQRSSWWHYTSPDPTGGKGCQSEIIRFWHEVNTLLLQKLLLGLCWAEWGRISFMFHSNDGILSPGACCVLPRCSWGGSHPLNYLCFLPHLDRVRSTEMSSAMSLYFNGYSSKPLPRHSQPVWAVPHSLLLLEI